MPAYLQAGGQRLCLNYPAGCFFSPFTNLNPPGLYLSFHHIDKKAAQTK